ncbi:MAG: 30S ribosomal protein S9 [Planctomycetes bacterium]|nr:30S ribosomal protein S9 [Planctomycetota bacterium]
MTATQYVLGLGRRKTSVARVRLKPGTGSYLVNGRAVDEFFRTPRDLSEAKGPLALLETPDSYDVLANVNGGGPHGQAGALSLGIARALKSANPALFERLRQGGFLTRDPRMKERKKYGRRGARRGFQFSKR